MWDSIQHLGIMPWAKGRRSTAKPPRRPKATCFWLLKLSSEVHCWNDEPMGRGGGVEGWEGQGKGSCSPTLASSTFSRSVSSDTLLQLRQPAGREDAGAGARCLGQDRGKETDTS